MNLSDRVDAFSKLGNYLSAIDDTDLAALIQQARNENAWFTDASVRQALAGIVTYLDKDSLGEWVARYPSQESSTKTVAVVLAGNIPMVGFHDILCVLIAGHNVMIKLSSKDQTLIRFLMTRLVALEPRFAGRINIVEQLKNFDAVIATGSDNSARYFDFYFSRYPHIIRRNRTSCAVLSGFETDEELTTLGKDVFTYFGLGCRNVSKLYVPQDFDLTRLLDSWAGFGDIIHHHKYNNNYDYQKSILLVNRVPFLDNGFVLLQESDKLVSPIAVVYYQFYKDLQELREIVASEQDKIQCIVGSMKPATISFGRSQQPGLTDYADEIDTLEFLTRI